MNTEKLYNALVNQDLLSISFDDFQKKLQDDSYKSKVHQTIVDQDLYSGDFNAFQKQYITGPGSTPKLDKEERGALDILKSYPARFYQGGLEIIDDFVKGYESGEAIGGSLGQFATEIVMENPFVASYGYAAEFLRGKGYDIPSEFKGIDLTTPRERRQIYENFIAEARDKGLSLIHI